MGKSLLSRLDDWVFRLRSRYQTPKSTGAGEMG